MSAEISVVIALYNKEQTIRRAVKSVLAQSFTDFELIIVDDGSTDKSCEIASSIADDRIRLLHRPNGGAGAARNTGLAEANGEMVAFLDADDFWLPQYLENAFAEMERTKVGVVGTSYYDFPDASDSASSLKRAGIKAGPGSVETIRDSARLFAVMQFFHVGNSLIRTEAARAVRGFDERRLCGEDTIFFYRLLARNEYSIINETAVCHDRRHSSLSAGLPEELPAIYTDPACVLNFCPAAFKERCELVISRLALNEARRRARRGRRREAELLRNSFPLMTEYPGDFARLSREIAFSGIYKPITAFKRLTGPPLRRKLRRFLSPSLPKIEDLESRSRLE
jgi:glycosyltransferase involved in cell wall biosynthesis